MGCVCWREGVALLLQFSLSARFFNFTPHFPLVSFSHTHPLIFMGNRQAAAGLSVALLSPAGMQDHRRYSSERTRGGGITNDSLKCSCKGGGKATGKNSNLQQKIKETNIKKRCEWVYYKKKLIAAIIQLTVIGQQ